MKPWIWKMGLLVATVVTGGFFLQRLHRENERFRHQVAELQARNEKAARLRAENERTRKLLAQLEQGQDRTDEILRGEVEKTRAEVERLEDDDRQRQLRRATAAAALKQNRNPETGPVRLEHFENVGRATPGAALQTLLWAVTKGEDKMVGDMLAIDPSVKLMLEGWRATLPAETQAKYPTAESLAALYLTGALIRNEAARLEGQEFLDAQHAVLSVGFRRDQPARPLEMQLGPNGWQLSITAKMAAEMPRH